MPALCRDCFATFEPAPRCPACGRPRVIAHPELFDLTVAHMDCDAFFAAVEKRDNPALKDKPLIIGGGHRGVVSTACYLARIKGVRSAMPMFKARALCPEAVILPGRMARYVEVSRQVRALMEALTPAIEPLSLDEAFLDMRGTARLHGAPPAVMLARLTRQMRAEIGISGSIGLSHNKFLAKMASDLDKPDGFAVIGAAETLDFLAERPVRDIWGIGPATQEKLARAGVQRISDLRRWERATLTERFGSIGDRLWHLARGQDSRRISRARPIKSISHETTFAEDTAAPELLRQHLWPLAEKCAERAKSRDLAGKVVMLKLKRSNHKSLTRRITLDQPTQLADVIFRRAQALLDGALGEGPFRLIGVGLSALCPGDQADPSADLLDPQAGKRAAAERATDAIRARFGQGAIRKGRGLG